MTAMPKTDRWIVEDSIENYQFIINNGGTVEEALRRVGTDARTMLSRLQHEGLPTTGLQAKIHRDRTSEKAEAV